MGTAKRNRPKELAGKLRLVREKLNLGQVEMARKLQGVEETVYPGLVSRFEHGKVEPSLIVLLEYARLGGTTMEILVDDSKKLK